MNNSNQNIAAILANAPMLEVQPQQRAQQQAPFVWGKGGQRVPPNQLAAQRAAAMMKSDYSPVGHWTQGLGRVADNVLGSIEMRDINRREQAASEASQQAQQSALAGLNLPPEIAAGISSTDPATQKVAMALWEAQQPQQTKPLEFQQMLMDSGYQPGTAEYEAEARKLLQARTDPFITASLPGSGFYGGPQSGFMTAIQGGGDPSFSPGAGTALQPPANIPSGSPVAQRPTGMSDVDLLRQAEEAVKGGADPYAVMERLKAWGVSR